MDSGIPGMHDSPGKSSMTGMMGIPVIPGAGPALKYVVEEIQDSTAGRYPTVTDTVTMSPDVSHPSLVRLVHILACCKNLLRCARIVGRQAEFGIHPDKVSA